MKHVSHWMTYAMRPMTAEERDLLSDACQPSGVEYLPRPPGSPDGVTAGTLIANGLLTINTYTRTWHASPAGRAALGD